MAYETYANLILALKAELCMSYTRTSIMCVYRTRLYMLQTDCKLDHAVYPVQFDPLHS